MKSRFTIQLHDRFMCEKYFFYETKLAYNETPFLHYCPYLDHFSSDFHETKTKNSIDKNSFVSKQTLHFVISHLLILKQNILKGF